RHARRPVRPPQWPLGKSSPPPPCDPRARGRGPRGANQSSAGARESWSIRHGIAGEVMDQPHDLLGTADVQRPGGLQNIEQLVGVDDALPMLDLRAILVAQEELSRHRKPEPL